MTLAETCPCPKVSCENRGNCTRCTSFHLNKESLNACAFFAVLPTLQKAIAASPESPTAQILVEMIQKRLNTYSELNRQSGRDATQQLHLLKEMADYCTTNG